MHGPILELYSQARAQELRQDWPSKPEGRRAATPSWRRPIARKLVGLGLRLDADASRSALRSASSTARLNRSDA